MTLVPNVSKIALLSAKAIGEFSFTLPAVASLKDAYPDSEIVLLAKSWAKRFFEGRPGPIDRAAVIPGIEGLMLPDEALSSEAEVEAFYAAMRAESFDLAVQIHGPGAHANPQVSLLGARLTAGCHGVSALQLERSLPHLSTQHEVFRWLDVVAQVGAQGMPTEAVLTLTKEDEAAAADALPASAGELVALNPGSFLRRQQWPVEKFTSLARRLVERGAQVVLLGSAADAPLAASVQEELQGQVIDLTGKLTERALAGVLVRCRLVVGNDSDALRLAQALQTPTVGIYWSRTLMNVGPLRQDRHRVAVAWSSACPTCGVDLTQDRCDHEDSLVAGVLEEEVLRDVLELLDR